MRLRLLLTGFLVALVGVARAYEPAGTPDDWPNPIPDKQPYGLLFFERLEARYADEVDTYLWDLQGWYGGDYHRLWLKSEGEGARGESPESAEVQALYSNRFATFWDWQLGVRYDVEPKPKTAYAVIGLQGLMPYKFEWDSAVFVSDEGDVTARIEAEYDLRITQRLVLQPRLELNAAVDDVPELGLGSGLNTSELGVRMRYEFRREFAPYIGVSWEKRYGDTADFARQEGEPTSATFVLVGLRSWF